MRHKLIVGLYVSILGALICFQGYSDGLDPQSPEMVSYPELPDSSKLSPQEKATQPVLSNSIKLLNPYPVNPTSSDILNKIGLYSLGGQWLIDRNVIFSSSITAPTVTVSSAAISNQLNLSGVAVNQCLQTDGGNNVIASGGVCASAGVVNLAVYQQPGPVKVSSPTTGLSLTSNFNTTLLNLSTAQIDLAANISVTTTTEKNTVYTSTGSIISENNGIIAPLFQIGAGNSAGLYLGYNTGTPACLNINSGNEIFGSDSLGACTTSFSITGVGSDIFGSLTTGFEDTTVGYHSQQKATTATSDTSLGAFTLQNNVTGNDETAISENSLATLHDGDGNTCTGYASCQGLYSASYNNASGDFALNNSSTGINDCHGAFSCEHLAPTVNAVGALGTGNATNGYNTLLQATTAYQCVATGQTALLNNNAFGNVGNGYAAGASNVYGSSNVWVGWDTGDSSLQKGNNQVTLIGFSSQAPGPVTNAIALGALTSVSTSNTAVIGGPIDASNGVNLIVSSITTGGAVLTYGVKAATAQFTGIGPAGIVQTDTNGNLFSAHVSVSTGLAAGNLASNIIVTNQISLSTGVFGNLPSNQISGTTTNDNASSGNLGEYVSSSSLAGTISSPGNNQWFTVGKITLTAGDWDVSGVVELSQNSATGTEFQGCIGTADGNSGAGCTEGDTSFDNEFPTTNNDSVNSIPNVRKSISTTTTFYLKDFAAFSAGTPKGGGRISARRVR